MSFPFAVCVSRGGTGIDAKTREGGRSNRNSPALQINRPCKNREKKFSQDHEEGGKKGARLTLPSLFFCLWEKKGEMADSPAFRLRKRKREKVNQLPES